MISAGIRSDVGTDYSILFTKFIIKVILPSNIQNS